MFHVRRKISLSFLLLLLTLSVAAQDVVVQRGCRVGTPRPVGMALRRGAPSGQPKQVGGDFYHGERHQLTVLVSFNDQQFLEDDPMPLWNNILNGVNYTEGSFRGSVYDYFYAQSDGQFRLHFDVQRVVLDQSRMRYSSTPGLNGDDENSQYLVQDIMEILKTRDIDWSLYDWNGDGFVNQLLIIYAGKGMNLDGDDNTIWPHQWWMSSHRKDYHKSTYQPDVYCDPIPVTYGGKQYLVDCYCTVAEEAYGDYRTFGILCHEYTHCFGFPDFYGTKKTPHYWDLMDASYNNNGFCPGNYSAHERMMMGWFTPIPLVVSETISDMPANEAYIIYNDAHPDEYYMVENRQKTGWDSSLPGSGLVVFHVDFDEERWLYYVVNSENKLRYRIIPANNKQEYRNNEANWSYPYLANDSLTNYSEPAATLNNENTDGTKLMNKSLRDISITDGKVSFRFTIDQSTGIDELQAEGHPRELYRIGPIAILRYPNGVVRKVVRKN